MDSKELGRRLKAARLAKKMTQSEVVGDFITRNMLSQIESGVATPSIKTLEYLANVLEISMASLMPESDNAASSASEAEKIAKAKKALAQNDNAAVLDILGEDCVIFSDEVYALRSIAYLALANEAAESGELQRAVDCAKRSYEYAGMGIYKNSSRAEESLRLMNKSAKKLSEYYAALITE